MPKYRVTSPDGSVYEVSAPEGASEADVMAYAKAEFAKQAPVIEKPAAVKAGETLGGIPRQLGLAARYAIEGPAQFAQIATEPLRLLSDKVAGAVRGTTLSDLVAGKPQSRPLSAVASQFADTLGLPSPDGANERVIGDASRLVAGAGAGGMAGRVAQELGGMAGSIGGFFAANPAQQAAGAAWAGLAGGSVREAGGGPWAQAGAALVGGIAAPLAMSAGTSAARTAGNAGRRMLDEIAPRNTPGAMQQVDQQIALTLRQQGIDWSQVPERIKQPMRDEVAQALSTGGNLNPEALRRLLDFRRTGTTPTRGMLTQDPVQITREMNLSKTGANSTDIGLQRLPNLQNQNDTRLLSLLDDAGARGAPDNFAAGDRGVGAVEGWVNGRKAIINNLYSQARDSQGRSVPLDGAGFTREANALLQKNLSPKLGDEIDGALNDIANGKTPLTVEYAEKLKTILGRKATAAKATNGDLSYAYGLVRRALDNANPLPSPQVNPGNLPAVAGTVPTSDAVIGADAIQAFNRARHANRGMMQRVEQSPALGAVYKAMQDGQRLDPDRFVQQFITGQGASVADVRTLSRVMGADPTTAQALRQNVVAHLKSAATNGTDDVTKFSPAAYNKALMGIGERKLQALGFSTEEIATLQSVGRASTLMKAQPTGTAVNNSNSGALLLGRAMSMLDSVAGKLPLGLDTTIQGTLRGFQQGQAMSVPRSLLAPTEQTGLLTRLGMPAVYGGLLAAQPVD